MDRKTSAFIEKIGLYFENSGLSLSAGRVIGLMMISSKPLTLDEIAETLDISKASVSLATRLLESAAMVDRVSVRGDRKIRYKLAGGHAPTLMKKKGAAITYLADLLKEGCELFQPDEKEAKARLQEMEEFYRFLAEQFEKIIDQWLEKKNETRDNNGVIGA